MPPPAEHRGFMGYRSSRAVTPGGRRRRNAEDGNRKHMSASEKAPVSREGRIPGGEGSGGSKHSDRAHTRMHTHTHTKGFVKTRPRKRGRFRTSHLFSASAGSPFKFPGHSVTGEEGLGVCRRYSVIRKQSGDDEVRTHVPSDIKNSRSFFLGRDLGRPPVICEPQSPCYIYARPKKKKSSHPSFPP